MTEHEAAEVETKSVVHECCEARQIAEVELNRMTQALAEANDARAEMLTLNERLREAWRADRDEILKGAAANALNITARAVQGERERVSALLASIPDEWYPQDVFGGPLSTDESRQANELLKAEGLPTFDRVGANAMRHAYRNAARMALEEPNDE